MTSYPSTPAMADVAAVILAGGVGSRLHDLTERDCKPALSIGTGARLIDFTLANVANSGIGRAWLLSQYRPDTLHGHVTSNWAADQSGLAIDILGGDKHGPFQGTADAVRRVMGQIDKAAPRQVVILAGDHMYQMDYRPFVEQHRASRAEVTVGAVHVPMAEAHQFGVMTVDHTGRIRAFAEKPSWPAPALDRPGNALASMGIYVFDWPLLRRLLDGMASLYADLDFGKHLIPALVGNGEAFAYALPAMGDYPPFWKDLGTIDAYHGTHVALARGEAHLSPHWPLGSNAGVSRDADDGAGNVIAATARTSWATLDNCTVGDRALVGVASILRNVVVMPGARIGRGVKLENAIVTSDARVPDGFSLAALGDAGAWCTTSENGVRIISASALAKLAERPGAGAGSAPSPAREPAGPMRDTTGWSRSPSTTPSWCPQ